MVDGVLVQSTLELIQIVRELDFALIRFLRRRQ